MEGRLHHVIAASAPPHLKQPLTRVPTAPLPGCRPPPFSLLHWRQCVTLDADADVVNPISIAHLSSTIPVPFINQLNFIPIICYAVMHTDVPTEKF